jgi:hypothetical protein
MILSTGVASQWFASVGCGRPRPSSVLSKASQKTQYLPLSPAPSHRARFLPVGTLQLPASQPVQPASQQGCRIFFTSSSSPSSTIISSVSSHPPLLTGLSPAHPTAPLPLVCPSIITTQPQQLPSPPPLQTSLCLTTSHHVHHHQSTQAHCRRCCCAAPTQDNTTQRNAPEKTPSS